MKVGNINIPCGCDSRRDIMFTQGGAGVGTFAIFAASALLVVAAWRLNKER